ncbi:MAG TPA: hypothetical protein VN646_16420 [Candidatus Acidoferrum sp.]|jgi:hypothetical protein|nr:hypothetical protein [Candidatus Acidoferrum sp.]
MPLACSRRPGACFDVLVHEVGRRDAGAHLMPSFGRCEVLAEVLDAVH